MLQQTVRCRVREKLLDLTDRDDHIAEPLTIQITSHMNHYAVRQFNSHAAAMV